jgi:hypothetical protein
MKLSKKEFLDILRNKEACTEAVKWVKESKAETFIDLWNECDRADWMLWIMAKMIKEKEWPSRKTVVLCACDCAETTFKFIFEDEPRPKIAIQTARKWAEGKASKIECKKAAYAAAAAACDAHAYDAYDAYDAAAASSYAAYATDAACDAASAASSAAASYDDSVAEKEALKNMADIIRKRVPF